MVPCLWRSSEALLCAGHCRSKNHRGCTHTPPGQGPHTLLSRISGYQVPSPYSFVGSGLQVEKGAWKLLCVPFPCPSLWLRLACVLGPGARGTGRSAHSLGPYALPVSLPRSEAASQSDSSLGSKFRHASEARLFLCGDLLPRETVGRVTFLAAVPSRACLPHPRLCMHSGWENALAALQMFTWW